MNKERIKYAISIMEQAQNLNMGTWQDYDLNTPATTMEELHTCGNTACFAGYIALSPLFKAEGGVVDSCGEPIMGEEYGEEAILKFFEMDEKYIPLMWAIVYGHLGDLYIGEYLDLMKDKGLNGEIIHQINEICELTHWDEWEPKHVISVLEALVDGEFDWLLEKGNE